eukprot:11714127-Karenia_brevis.AAC.1
MEPGSIGDTGPAVCNVGPSPCVADHIPVCLHGQALPANRDNMTLPTIKDFIFQMVGPTFVEVSGEGQVWCGGMGSWATVEPGVGRHNRFG